MSKKTTAVLFVLGIIAIFGIGGAFAVDNLCPADPELEGLRAKIQDPRRSQAEKDTLNNALTTGEEDRWQRCSRVLFMTEKEKAKILEEKRKGHEQYIKEMQERAASSTEEVARQTVLGIAELMPPPELKGEFIPSNAWNGYAGKKVATVFVGGSSLDPMQGLVVVSESNGTVGLKTYPTPTATGPVKITSESDGVLTLESIAGKFGRVEEPSTGIVAETVTTPGGSIYYFNISTRTFQ